MTLAQFRWAERRNDLIRRSRMSQYYDESETLENTLDQYTKQAIENVDPDAEKCIQAAYSLSHELLIQAAAHESVSLYLSKRISDVEATQRDLCRQVSTNISNAVNEYSDFDSKYQWAKNLTQKAKSGGNHYIQFTTPISNEMSEKDIFLTKQNTFRTLNNANAMLARSSLRLEATMEAMGGLITMVAEKEGKTEKEVFNSFIEKAEKKFEYLKRNEAYLEKLDEYIFNLLYSNVQQQNSPKKLLP